MKAITREKLYEQHGAELGRGELRERQMQIARAWLAGFRSESTGEACAYAGELADVWSIGRLEAEKRRALLISAQKGVA